MLEKGYMNSLKKQIRYELWIRVECPHCIASEKEKEVFVSLPLKSMPKNIRCFNCDKMIDIKDIQKTGKEIIKR